MLKTEAKYIAIDYASREDLWIRQFINELVLKKTDLILKNNNKANISFTKIWESELHKTHRRTVLLDPKADKWQRVNSWVGIECKDSGR